MENPKSKLIILFANGHEEKRNIYAPSKAENYVKNLAKEKKIKSAVWFDGEGKEVDLLKAKGK